MKKFYFMRHCKAAGFSESGQDMDRPLTEAGREAAEKMARFLGSLKTPPRVILSSPAVRCRDTARLVEKAVQERNEPVRMETRDLLYDSTLNAEKLFGLLAGMEEDPPAVLVVGHNPACENIIYEVARQHLPVPAGGLCVYKIQAGDWTALAGPWQGLDQEESPPENGDRVGVQFQEFIRPKELR